MDSGKALDRLRKLLRRAKDSASAESEVNAAMAVARKLMDEYNLSEEDAIRADFQAAQGSDDVCQARASERTGGIDRMEKNLAWVCCELLDVQWYLDYVMKPRVRGKTHDRFGNQQYVQRECIVFYGYKRDVAIAQVLLPEFFSTMKAMSRLRIGKGWTKPHWEYCRGFSRRMMERARDLKQKAIKDQAAEAGKGCTALVVMKDEIVSAWGDANLCLETKKARSSHIKDPGAYAQGLADGNEISLDTDGLAGNSKDPTKKLR